MKALKHPGVAFVAAGMSLLSVWAIVSTAISLRRGYTIFSLSAFMLITVVRLIRGVSEARREALAWMWLQVCLGVPFWILRLFQSEPSAWQIVSTVALTGFAIGSIVILRSQRVKALYASPAKVEAPAQAATWRRRSPTLSSVSRAVFGVGMFFVLMIGLSYWQAWRLDDAEPAGVQLATREVVEYHAAHQQVPDRDELAKLVRPHAERNESISLASLESVVQAYTPLATNAFAFVFPAQYACVTEIRRPRSSRSHRVRLEANQPFDLPAEYARLTRRSVR